MVYERDFETIVGLGLSNVLNDRNRLDRSNTDTKDELQMGAAQ